MSSETRSEPPSDFDTGSLTVDISAQEKNDKDDVQVFNHMTKGRPRITGRGRRTMYASLASPKPDKSPQPFKRRQSSPASTSTSTPPASNQQPAQESSEPPAPTLERRRIGPAGGRQVLPALPSGGVKLRRARSSSRRPTRSQPTTPSETGITIREVDEEEDFTNETSSGSSWVSILLGTLLGTVVVATAAAGGFWVYQNQIKQEKKQDEQ